MIQVKAVEKKKEGSNHLLYKAEASPLIILITGKVVDDDNDEVYSGVVICPNANYSIGQYSEGWAAKTFYPYYGVVTLTE